MTPTSFNRPPLLSELSPQQRHLIDARIALRRILADHFDGRPMITAQPKPEYL